MSPWYELIEKSCHTPFRKRSHRRRGQLGEYSNPRGPAEERIGSHTSFPESRRHLEIELPVLLMDLTQVVMVGIFPASYTLMLADDGRPAWQRDYFYTLGSWTRNVVPQGLRTAVGSDSEATALRLGVLGTVFERGRPHSAILALLDRNQL